jgi:hypothetical protein
MFCVETLTLAGNVGWFGAATLYFGLLPGTAAKWMLTDKQLSNPLVAGFKHALRFLGGMNAGMLTLSTSMFLCRRGPSQLFQRAAERRLIFLAFAVGHFTQWALNVPVARKLRRTMRLIFVVDFLAAAANLYCAGCAKDDAL